MPGKSQNRIRENQNQKSKIKFIQQKVMIQIDKKMANEDAGERKIENEIAQAKGSDIRGKKSQTNKSGQKFN